MCVREEDIRHAATYNPPPPSQVGFPGYARVSRNKNSVPEKLQFDVTLAVVSFFLNYRPENRANHIAPLNYNVQQEVHCDTVVCDKDTMRKNYCVS
jgi:hypothetical protein